jgi:hypothetical protein
MNFAAPLLEKKVERLREEDRGNVEEEIKNDDRKQNLQ